MAHKTDFERETENEIAHDSHRPKRKKGGATKGATEHRRLDRHARRQVGGAARMPLAQGVRAVPVRPGAGGVAPGTMPARAGAVMPTRVMPRPVGRAAPAAMGAGVRPAGFAKGGRTRRPIPQTDYPTKYMPPLGDEMTDKADRSRGDYTPEKKVPFDDYDRGGHVRRQMGGPSGLPQGGVAMPPGGMPAMRGLQQMPAGATGAGPAMGPPGGVMPASAPGHAAYHQLRAQNPNMPAWATLSPQQQAMFAGPQTQQARMMPAGAMGGGPASMTPGGGAMLPGGGMGAPFSGQVPGMGAPPGAQPMPRPAGMKRGGKTSNFHPGGEKGKLHRELGIPEGEKIGSKRIAEATRSRDPEIRRDAIRARTMSHWDKG